MFISFCILLLLSLNDKILKINKILIIDKTTKTATLPPTTTTTTTTTTIIIIMIMIIIITTTTTNRIITRITIKNKEKWISKKHKICLYQCNYEKE